MPTRMKARRPVPRRRDIALRKHGFAVRSPKKVLRPHAVKGQSRSRGASKARTGGISSYAKALRFLNTLNDYERLRIVRYNNETFNLDRMRALLRKLGNPQTRYRTVHVAGTKGKGSTCAMVAGMLSASGYKVGLYTSPH